MIRTLSLVAATLLCASAAAADPIPQYSEGRSLEVRDSTETIETLVAPSYRDFEESGVLSGLSNDSRYSPGSLEERIFVLEKALLMVMEESCSLNSTASYCGLINAAAN